MCVLGVDGSEKKSAAAPEDNFWNSPKGGMETKWV